MTGSETPPIRFVVPSSVWVDGGYLDRVYRDNPHVQLDVRQRGRGKQVIVDAPVAAATDIYRYLRDRAAPLYGDPYARRAAARAADELRPLLRAAGVDVR